VGLAVLPMFHVTGMQANLNGPLYMGATVVVLPRWDRETAAALHRAPPRHQLAADHHDGGRLHGQPALANTT
jgi:fatty-acyl-CoA synthase